MPQRQSQVEELDFDPTQPYEEMDFDPTKPFTDPEGVIGTGKGAIKRGPTMLESARGAMLELPQEVLGTVAPMALRKAGPFGGIPGAALDLITKHAAGIGLAGLGGAAGRYLTESAKALPTGIRGYMVGGVPGAILDAITSFTAQDPTYEPRPREDPGIGEAALMEAGAESLGRGVGGVLGGIRKTLGAGELLPPKPMFGQPGKDAAPYATPHATSLEMARATDLPVLPSDVKAGGLGVAMESIARYGSAGRRQLDQFLNQREASLITKLKSNLDEVSDAMSPEMVGQKVIQNFDAYRTEAFDAPAGQLYDQAEKLMAMQTQTRQLPGEPIYSDVYERIGTAPGKTIEEQVGPFVDMRPIKQMIKDEFDALPEFRKHVLASDNKQLEAFLRTYETIPDQVSFTEARAMRSDILSMMRQTSTLDKVKRTEGEAVDLYNKALRDSAERSGSPQAIEMVEAANALWKKRGETFFNATVESLMKKGDVGPESIGKMIWQPGAITQTRKALQATGGKLTSDESGRMFIDFKSPERQKAWNITRRAGFQNILDAATKGAAKDPGGTWATWWDKLNPDQRLLIANGDPALKSQYDELFHTMGEFSAAANREKSKGLGLQSPEKTALVYAGIAAATGGLGTLGYMEGGTPGGLVGAGGFLALAFGGPAVMAKLLLSKRGTAFLVDGTQALKDPSRLTAANILKYSTRALSLAANTNEATAQYEPKSMEPVPTVEPIEPVETLQ